MRRRALSSTAGAWVLSTLVASAALAMPADDGVETLESAWRQALAADAELAASGATTASARDSEQAAKAARWPTLELAANYTRFADAPALSVVTPDFSFASPRIFDNDDIVTGGAQLSWPIYAGGSLTAGARAATAVRVAAEANEEAATAALKLDVARLFIDVWHARKLRDAAQAATRALEAHVATVEAMVEGELRSRADLLASKVALASAQDALIRAEHAVALSQAAYNRRLGAPLSRVPNLAEQLPVVRDLRREDLSQLQTKALAQRAELAAASAGRDALAAQSRAETGKRLPRVAVLAGYQHLESTILDREDFSMVGIGLQWSLFDGGQARSKAAALRRAGEALDWQRKSLQSAIELEVQQHWLGVDAADARALVARDALAQADENLRMARELYAVEMIANGQVLEAVALQQAAAAQATRATMDTVMARLALLRSVGEL